MDKVKTGDLLLCSNNGFNAMVLRTATSSLFNHVSLAIRILTKNGKNRISITEEGELHCLEISPEKRWDPYFNNITSGGVSITDLSFLTDRYSIIMCRPINDIFRTKRFVRLINKYIKRYKNWQFSDSLGPFISAWIGVDISDQDEILPSSTIFCSQMAIYFYHYCIGYQYKSIFNQDYNQNLKQLFSVTSPDNTVSYSPERFSFVNMNDSVIFSSIQSNNIDILRNNNNKEFLIHRVNVDPVISAMYITIIWVAFLTLISLILVKYS